MRTFVIAWSETSHHQTIPRCERVQATSVSAALRKLQISAEETYKIFEVTGPVVLSEVSK
jgi:hypothetical protein